MHADDADLTFNLCITPDSANLDPTTGIVICNEKVPKDWSFDDYNSGEDPRDSSSRVNTLNRRVFPIVRTERPCLKDTCFTKLTGSPSADSLIGDAI